LHGINWQNGYEALKPVLPPLDFAERQVRWWARQAATVGATDLDEGIGWLRAHLYHTRDAKSQTLIHRDFHPDNILVVGDRISGVVDWGELTIADPSYDVGWSRMVLTTEVNIDLGDRFIEAYTRRNPAVNATLPFWEVFSAVKRLATIATIKANKSERLAMWADAPDLARQVGREDSMRDFLAVRVAADDSDK
jgi:aminoglycoside phosphotransferase (APT) family kinase protein